MQASCKALKRAHPYISEKYFSLFIFVAGRLEIKNMYFFWCLKFSTD